MDRIAEWRPVEPAGPDGPGIWARTKCHPRAGKPPDGNAANRRLLGASLVLVSVAVCACGSSDCLHSAGWRTQTGSRNR